LPTNASTVKLSLISLINLPRARCACSSEVQNTNTVTQAPMKKSRHINVQLSFL
jgi:hypothetical protein